MNPKVETEMKQIRIIWLMALFLTSVIAWGQTTALTDNGDGTWTLASMPGYNVALEVEYEDATPEDAISLINNGDGTWTLSSMPGYNVALQVEYEDDNTPTEIDLIDNGDGTWTLPSMPAYNVALEVEYEDDDSNPEVYTEFAEETGTLTYYYDARRSERTGITEVYDPVTTPLHFGDYYNKVLKVVIHPSMKKAHLTSMKNMFYGGLCTSPVRFQSLSNVTNIEGLENLSTEDVTDMSSMFCMCQKLTTLDLSSFETSNVTNMNAMFSTCSNLQMADVTSFDVSKVTDMGYMFNSCSNLQTICCFSDWSSNSAKSNNMFSGCTSLVGGKGTMFDSNFTDKTYARPDGGTSKPGYFTAKAITGDLNGDGKVDIADAVTVLNIMAAGEYKAEADINGDNKVDIADFVTILNIMAAQ